MKNTGLRSTRLLLFEDNPGDLKIITEILAEIGAAPENIGLASSVAQGFHNLDNNSYDIILLDLSLTDSQGYDTFVKVRDYVPQIPIVVLTGLDDDNLARRMVATGGQDYLTKGDITPALLSRAVKYAISRQHALRELRERASELEGGEKLLQTITVENPDAILVIDEAGTIRLANPAAEVLFDCQPGELLGKPFEQSFDDRPFAEIAIPRAIGDTVYAEMRMVATEWDGKPAFLATLRDVTERNVIAAALQEREKLLSEIISSVKDAVIVIDHEGKVTTFNAAAELMFGRKADEILGRSPDPLIPASYRVANSDYLRSYLVPGESSRAIGELIELPALRSSGDIFPVEISLAGCECGGKRFLVGVARDISKRRQEESALKETNRKLCELDQLKSDFLSTASHELRTPLTIIAEFAAILRDGIAGVLSTEQMECVDSILSNTKRLSALINDVLDLQKIESGRLKLVRRECDLRVLLEQAAHDFQPSFKSKTQLLHLRASSELPSALADPARITQVLVNLIGNAHKFTPVGGEVTISADSTANGVEVSIADNGPGIPKEVQGRIFERFTQLERRNGPGCKGTGLGLAIARSIVALHEGEISVESTPELGSTFRFALPVYTERKAAQALIRDRLVGMRADGKRVSLGLIRMACDDCSSPAPGVIPQEAIDEAHDIAKGCLRREDDRVFKISAEGLLLVLCEADVVGAATLMQRVLRAVIQNLKNKVPLSFSFSTIEADVESRDWLELATSSLAQVDPNTCGIQVLVVDDDKDLIETVTKALENSGMHLVIETTTNGYDACIRVGKMVPDLVVLDVSLPNHDGCEVLKLIKRSPHTRDSRVLVISGDEQRLAEMMALGADSSLVKPFAPVDLVDQVQALLSRPPVAEPEPSVELVLENHN
jgi:PAS domain S-box-containing protein